MLTDDSHAKELDLVGLRCPTPIVRLMKTILELNVGETLRARANDPAFEVDLMAWARTTGHELVKVDRADGIVTTVVRKTQP